MKKIYLNSRFGLREDYLENWVAINPVLERGEPSVVRNPVNEGEWLKIGDGTTAWNDLPYRVAPRGLDGNPGVYVGTGNMPEDCNMQIDPDGDAFTVEDIIEKVIESQTVKISSVTLNANDWVGETSPYSQAVEISGATENSKINLNPTVEQLNIFYNKDVSFVVENDDGNITVYCIGQKPTNDYTMQATITEVVIDG